MTSKQTETMNTITDQLVTFETAKLLKEKGFDANTDCYYMKDGKVYSPI